MTAAAFLVGCVGALVAAYAAGRSDGYLQGFARGLVVARALWCAR